MLGPAKLKDSEPASSNAELTLNGYVVCVGVYDVAADLQLACTMTDGHSCGVALAPAYVTVVATGSR